MPINLDDFDYGRKFHDRVKTSWGTMRLGLELYCEFTKMNPNELFKDRRATFHSEDLTTSRKHEDIYAKFLKWLELRPGGEGREHYSPNSIKTRGPAVKDFYSRICFAPLVKPDSVEVIKVRKTVVPTVEQVSKMLVYMTNPVVRAASCAALQSGMGVGELLRLKWTDESTLWGTVKEQLPGDKPIHIEQTRKKTHIAFQTFLGTATKKLLQVEGYPMDDERVFPISDALLEQDVKAAAAAIGIYTTPHRLRARFNTTLKLAGVDPDVVEIFMAHALPLVKAAYLGAAGEELREIYMKVESKLTPQLPDLTPPPSTEENGKEVADGPSK